MPIKVNVTILNHHPGDIIRQDSGDYERFLSWAEKKDKFQGNIICEIVEDKIPEVQAETETQIETEETLGLNFKCDQCDFVAANENGLKIHKAKAHKE